MIYENEIRYVLCLLKCAVSDEIPPNPPENLDWEVIFKIGKSHKIYSTLFFGLQKLSPSLYSSIPHFEDYATEYRKNLVLDTNRSFEIDIIKKELKKNDIDFVLLKGTVIKYLYPDTAMRVMSDVDILYRSQIQKINRQNELLISLMENIGYKVWSREPLEISFYKPLAAISRNMRIEMQTELIDKGYEVWSDYLKNIWDKLIKKSDHEYVMRDEDFYIYHIIHMAKHFINGGIGIVHILDIWIMINAYRSVDKDYIAGELKSIGLLDFEKNARTLCKYWFSNDYVIPDDYTRKTLKLMETFVISNGAYGTSAQAEANRVVEDNGKKVSLMAKIFPKKNIMINYYGDILKKHPSLLPFYYIRLNLKRVFLAPKSSSKRLKAMNSVTDRQISKTRELMKRCGL